MICIVVNYEYLIQKQAYKENLKEICVNHSICLSTIYFVLDEQSVCAVLGIADKTIINICCLFFPLFLTEELGSSEFDSQKDKIGGS